MAPELSLEPGGVGGAVILYVLGSGKNGLVFTIKVVVVGVCINVGRSEFEAEPGA